MFSGFMLNVIRSIRLQCRGERIKNFTQSYCMSSWAGVHRAGLLYCVFKIKNGSKNTVWAELNRPSRRKLLYKSCVLFSRADPHPCNEVRGLDIRLITFVGLLPYLVPLIIADKNWQWDVSEGVEVFL